jgi:hypothetical protein
MATSVSICSNALLRLGAQTIASLSESNDRARIAANLYESVRDSTLRSHPWNCAVKRVVLAPDVEVPAFDFTAQFTLPSDWMRTLQVGQDGFQGDYRTESGKIMASGTSLALRYIWRNTVESTWDAMLVEAMELAMAAAMAYGITKSSAMVETQTRLYRDHMKRCRATDGQDDPPDTLGDFPLMQSRFGGAFRYGPGR